MNDITIDEVEANEKIFLSEVIREIISNAYASCCKEAVWSIIEYESSDELDLWRMNYKIAIMDMNPNIVWLRAKEVSDMIKVKIHPTWWYFLKDLYEEEELADVVVSAMHLESVIDSTKTITERIRDVLTEQFPSLESSEETLTKSFSIEYSGIFTQAEYSD